MTLQDALSCGKIRNILIKDSYATLEEASSAQATRYGLSLSFKNLNGSVASDVGIRLENLKREQQYLIETKESQSASVGLVIKWKGATLANGVQEIDVLEFTPSEALEGYTAKFDNKAKIERGRFIDFIPEVDKTDIVPLSVEEANLITLYLQPKKFKDAKKPTEEVIGLFQDNVSPLVSSEDGGISSNALLAALVKSMQEVKSLMSQLYAKRVNSYSYGHELVLAIVTKIGLGNDISNGQELTTAIVTVGSVGSTLESTEMSEIVVPYIQ